MTKHPNDIMAEAIRAWTDAHKNAKNPGVVMVNLGAPGSNTDPIGGNELSQLLSKPSSEVKDLANTILKRMSPPNPHVRAPVAISALAFALAEAIVANASPPRQWAGVISERLQEMAAELAD
jgi:hypothetical protein